MCEEVRLKSASEQMHQAEGVAHLGLQTSPHSTEGYFGAGHPLSTEKNERKGGKEKKKETNASVSVYTTESFLEKKNLGEYWVGLSVLNTHSR